MRKHTRPFAIFRAAKSGARAWDKACGVLPYALREGIVVEELEHQEKEGITEPAAPVIPVPKSNKKSGW